VKYLVICGFLWRARGWTRRIREEEYLPRLSNLPQIEVIDGAQSTRLVGASALDVVIERPRVSCRKRP
jgi:hypothetical protein